MTREHLHKIFDLVLDVREETSACVNMETDNHGYIARVLIKDDPCDELITYDGDYYFCDVDTDRAPEENEKMYTECVAHLERLLQDNKIRFSSRKKDSKLEENYMLWPNLSQMLHAIPYGTLIYWHEGTNPNYKKILGKNQRDAAFTKDLTVFNIATDEQGCMHCYTMSRSVEHPYEVYPASLN